MGDKDKLLCNEAGEEFLGGSIKKDTSNKAPWYMGTGFILFWILLFFAIVIPMFYRLPVARSIEDAENGEFIGERAYKTLNRLVSIGPKVAGSNANELEGVLFLLNEIADIRNHLLEEYFTLEVDVHKTSGAYEYSDLLEMYQGVQNVVVKLSAKNSTSESFLLINSHFDTVLTSPGAGDDGFMVATMLEVLRVMATTRRTFLHPIIFLFNGDEEMGMQASHGFITQHKWAKNCKALINLDAAGSGGHDILFQTGPSHPWLVEYYRKHAKHPLATTLAEEVFQMGLIPSDTDFRILVAYGNLPGLDIGQFQNGYIYHTKYDRIEVIPQGAIQNTGDNILGLVRGLSNAPELYNTEAYETGHAVFFDFLGLFLVSYSVETGRILNYSIAAVLLLLILISVWRMSAVSCLSWCSVLQRLLVLLIVQIVGLTLGLVFPLLVAHYFDSFGLSLTYFTSRWLMIGLYVCPSLIGLSLPVVIYYQSQEKNKLPFIYHLQLGLHCWAMIVSILVIFLTIYGVRSTYIFTFSIAFYMVSLIINLITILHDLGYGWAAMVMTFQIVPFLYISSLFYTFIVAFTPMNGRSGSASNPDTMIAGLIALGTILCFGFLAPLLNMFRRPCAVIFILMLFSGITMYLASSTQIGFPYRTKTNTARAMYQHVRRVFYEYDGSISKDESGYLFNFQDRREEHTFPAVNLTGAVRTRSDCEKFMMCGFSLMDERWVENRLEGMWLRREEPIEPPTSIKLELLSKTVLDDARKVRFQFRLTGPKYLSLYIQAYEESFVTLTDWSFSQSYLKNRPAYPLTYHIYITYGTESSVLEFYLEFSKSNGDFNVPLFQLGVSAHNLGDKGDVISQQFASTFPAYVAVVSWPATYHRYIY